MVRAAGSGRGAALVRGRFRPGVGLSFPPFFSFFSGGLLDAQVFDSVGLSLNFDRLSTGTFDAYLFESKVRVVVQSHFQILRVGSRRSAG